MRMASGLDGRRLSSPFGDKVTRTLRDLTQQLNDIAFPKMIPGAVLWRHNTICGLPECGKTVTLDDRAYQTKKRYKDVNQVRTDDLNVAIEKINDQEVQHLQIDDASEYAASLAPYEVKEKIAIFQKLRHVFEERAETDTGIVIIDLGWQRWKEVYPTFRNGQTAIFKTGMSEPDDDNMIHRLIGDVAHQALHEIWHLMVLGNQQIKSTSIGYIPSLRSQSNAAGFYYSTYRKDWTGAPKMIYSKDYFGGDKMDIGFALDKIAKRGEDWMFKTECYTLVEIDGKTTTEVAEEQGKTQGWISKCVSAVKTELGKMGVA